MLCLPIMIPERCSCGLLCYVDLFHFCMGRSFVSRGCDSNKQVIAVSGKFTVLVPRLLKMAIVSYCGNLSQSGTCAGLHIWKFTLKVWIQLNGF